MMADNFEIAYRTVTRDNHGNRPPTRGGRRYPRIYLSDSENYVGETDVNFEGEVAGTVVHLTEQDLAALRAALAPGSAIAALMQHLEVAQWAEGTDPEAAMRVINRLLFGTPDGPARRD